MRWWVKPGLVTADARPEGAQAPVLMLEPRPRTHRRPCHVPALLVALCVTLAAFTPLAAGKTIEFQSAAPTRIDLGLPQPKLGVTGKVVFRTDAADRRALAAEKQKQELLGQATVRTDAAARADRRIAAIEQLLNDVQDDQARLESVISARLVEQYREGGDADLQFLLSGDGLSDLVTRGRVLGAQADQDRRAIDEYQITVARVEQYRAVLEELRDINGDQARSLQERAGRLDDVLVAAKAGDDEAPADAGTKAPKGVKGTWYVMDGAFTAQLFLPSGGAGYDGGTRTPARPATPMQIQAVLADKRIELDASGIQDVLTGQIDGRLLDAIAAAAQQFGFIKITSLKGDRDGIYTSSGNISAHVYGCAADIGTIGSTYITPSSQKPGSEVYDAVRFFDGLGLATGRPDLAPQQVISLFDLGGSTFALASHGDHIHLGYSC